MYMQVREYEIWSEFEQWVAWRQRAAWAVDAFGDILYRIGKLPEGKKKQALTASLGARNAAGTPLNLYECLWANANSGDAYLWMLPDSHRKVEQLEKAVVALKKELRLGPYSGGGMGELGQLETGTVVAIGAVAVAGVIGLGALLFGANKRRPPAIAH
jgi:hypothetical protein